MKLTINDIRAMLDSGDISPNENDIAQTGELATPTGKKIGYQLHHGWDPAKAYACDKSWGVYNLELMRFIKSKNYDPATKNKVLSDIQIDDGHWDWLTKTLVYKSAEHDWFFLMAEGYPQGACLIYHPKQSAIATGDIFYVEYIAAAPWNRANPMSPRSFKGVASILLRFAVNYAKNNLKLRYGFSLHALPKAEPFYGSIGMVKHPPYDKDNLPYFEMPENKALAFAGA